MLQLQDLPELEPEPPPAPPPSLDERLGDSGARKRPVEFAEHVPSALWGQSRTMEIVKPNKPNPFNWNNIISVLLLAFFGVGGFYLWPMLQSGELVLTGGPPKVPLTLSIDSQPAEAYKPASSVSLRVGEHTVKVSAKGFLPFQVKVIVKAKSPSNW